MGDAARKLPSPTGNVVAGPWAAKPVEPSLKDRTADVFSRVLPTAWPGYAPRDGQMVLTQAIADTLEKGGVLLAEGPCGTGKGLAYLVPAILAADKAGKTVVVVTASIALQEQLVQHDLPALAEALSGELTEPLTWTLLKGRGNYLCKHAADEPAPVYLTAEERDELRAVDAWARTTETGDRLELPMIVRDGVWAVRSMSTDDCLRDGCDHFDACFARKANAKAEGVRVLVINYHLLFAHIAVRRETMQDVVLPKTAVEGEMAWDTVLCDEAHEAGDIARDFLGCDLTERMVTKLASWVKADGEGRGSALTQQRNELAARIEREAAQLWRGMVDRVPRAERGRPDADRTQRLREGLDADALMASVVEAGKLAASVAAAIRRLGSEIEPDERKAMRRAENMHRRALKVASWLDAAVCPAEAPHVVLWLEVRTDKKGAERATLHGRVLDVGSVLRDELFARARAVVLASATLTTGAVPRVNALTAASASDAWGWIRAQLGLPASTPALAVASPFDFARQAVLCLPSGRDALPSPVKEREAFDVEICRVLEQVSVAAGGRTLGLFTSRRMAERAAEHLRAVGVPFPVLCQGDRPRPLLLAAMKAGPCVLCATSSFWTGVDLSGESVVAVVIDKMPFPGPDDPVLAALSELAFARTGDQWAGWREESLPRATLALRQGAGRLIRSVGDWGAVVVCDPRLTSARYGAGVVKALGMPAQVRSVEGVVRWFAARAGQTGGGAR